ncbi:hypothetical protein V8C34DRAFT_4927 [Trichoderma compactum]
MLLLTDLSINSWRVPRASWVSGLVAFFWLANYLLVVSSAAPPPPALCAGLCFLFFFLPFFINFSRLFLVLSYSTPSTSPSFPVSLFFPLMPP